MILSSKIMTKPAKIEHLTPKMHEAVLLLASGSGPSTVAKKVKISRSQLYEWRKQEAFESCVNDEVTSRLSYARMLLKSAAEQAVRELVALLSDSESESVRLRAAQTIISELSLGKSCPFSGGVEKGIHESANGFMGEFGWGLYE